MGKRKGHKNKSLWYYAGEQDVEVPDEVTGKKRSEPSKKRNDLEVEHLLSMRTASTDANSSSRALSAVDEADLDAAASLVRVREEERLAAVKELKKKMKKKAKKRKADVPAYERLLSAIGTPAVAAAPSKKRRKRERTQADSVQTPPASSSTVRLDTTDSRGSKSESNKSVTMRSDAAMLLGSRLNTVNGASKVAESRDDEESLASTPVENSFSDHFDVEWSDSDFFALLKRFEASKWTTRDDLLPLARVDTNNTSSKLPPPINSLTDERASLCDRFKPYAPSTLTELQRRLWPLLADYGDLLYTTRTRAHAQEIRTMYCLHIVNHLELASRRVRRNNRTLSRIEQNDGDASTYAIADNSVKDRGYTRPRVLVLLPFRGAAFRFVRTLLELLPFADNEDAIINMRRFVDEFADDDDLYGESAPENMPATMRRRSPENRECFEGDVDDCFRVGIALDRARVRLYANFYHSDIILASPLGLRLVTGAADGVEETDFDFLSSIEVLVADQTDVFLMQNWEHVQLAFDKCNNIPSKARNTDFSRVRPYALNGWAKYRRQTLLFARMPTPELNALYSRNCFNFGERRRWRAPPITDGAAAAIVRKCRQVFRRLDNISRVADVDDRRFETFKRDVMPAIRRRESDRVVVFASHYFDFLRLRDLFESEQLDYAFISEYSTKAEAQTRLTYFGSGRLHVLLITERYLFFRAPRIDAATFLVVYAPPLYSEFYSLLLNMSDQSVNSVTLYCRYDALAMERLVGAKRCATMLRSDRDVHILT